MKMKKIYLLLLVTLISIGFSAQVCDYQFFKTITIQSSQVSADLTDFPVMFSLTDPDLRTTANGGNVENANGYDIAFQATDGTPLDFQTESYDATTGELVVWVKIPALSSSIDTEIEMLYGNSSVSSDQSTGSVWSSGFSGVWHMNNDPSTSPLEDASGNGVAGQSGGSMTSTDVVTGKVGDAMDFDGTNDYFALANLNYSGVGTLPQLTVSAWVNTTFNNGAFNGNWSILDFDRSEYFNVYVHGDGRVGFSTKGGNTDDFFAGSAGDVNDGTWHFVTAVYDGTDKMIYIDGTLASTQTNPHGGSALGTANTRYGLIGDGSEASSFNGGKNNRYYEGLLDEVRYSEMVRSADWIGTEYNNQNSPGTFYSVGTQNAFTDDCNCYTYKYKKDITIQASQISGSGSHTDFPVLVSFTDADLISVANGGHVESDMGYDVVFKNTSGTLLDHQMEKYNPATGEYVAWVRIPSLSTSINTTIEVWYGNTGILSDQSTASVWNSDYNAVWHMENDPASGWQQDGTGNYPAKSAGGMTTTDLVSGKGGDGIELDGTNDYYAISGLSYSASGVIPQMSVACWVKTTYTGGANTNWAIIDFDRSEYFNVFVNGDGRASFSTKQTGIDDFNAGTAGDLNDGAWHHVVAVYDGTDKLLYIDGVLAGTKTNPHGGNPLGSGTTRFGFIGEGSEASSFNASRNNRYYEGGIDELRLMNIGLSADWITTEFNNQNNPSAFITVGSEQDLTNVWQGTNTAWTNPANWSNGVPTAYTDITIPSGLGNYPIINGANALGRSITIESGATLEITGTDTLFVNGDFKVQGTFTPGNGILYFSGECRKVASVDLSESLTVNYLAVDREDGILINDRAVQIQETLNVLDGTLQTGDSLIILSNSTATGRLLELGSTADVQGRAVIERYIDVGLTDWRLLTSAVQNTDFEQFDDDFITSGIPGTDYPNWPSAASPWPSIQVYDETQAGDLDVGLDPPSSTSYVLATGEGARVFCGDTITGTQPFTIDMVGEINKGDINLPVSYTNTGSAPDDGWSLVGNPYPCTIDWDDVDWVKTNINAAVYIWNPDLATFATYVPGVTPGTGIGLNGGSRYIASSQGFWVQTNAASPVLTAKESCKSDGDQTFIKATTPSLIRLHLNDGTYTDETVIRFEGSSTNNFDPTLDGWKLYNTGNWDITEIGTMLNGKDYSVNSLPSANQTVYMKVKGTIGTTMTLSVAEWTEDEVGCVILEDLIDGTIMLLDDQTSYSFTHAGPGLVTRFKLEFIQQHEVTLNSPSCYGDNNGSIDLQQFGQGPFDYEWKDLTGNSINTETSSGTASLANLEAGWYIVESGDQSVCPLMSDTVYLSEPQELLAPYSVLDESCTNCCDGEIVVSPSGGTAPYAYSWSHDALWNQGITTGLCTDQYEIIVTDANGCVTTIMVDVLGPNSIVENEEGVLSVFPNPSNGEFTIILKNGEVIEEVNVYDIAGNLVLTERMPESVLSENLSTGVYLLFVKGTSGTVFMDKVVVE